MSDALLAQSEPPSDIYPRCRQVMGITFAPHRSQGGLILKTLRLCRPCRKALPDCGCQIRQDVRHIPTARRHPSTPAYKVGRGRAYPWEKRTTFTTHARQNVFRAHHARTSGWG